MKYLLVLIVFVIGMLLVMPIEFKIQYNYMEDYNKLMVYTSYLFGLLKIKRYPFNNQKSYRYKQTEIKNIDKSIYNKRVLEKILDKIVIKVLNWETHIGFEDAFLVGIISGALWWFKSLFISVLKSRTKVEDFNYNIVPVFNKNQLNIIFDCIIKIRLVYIIIIWTWLLKINKGGGKIARASNRRFNENYNE